MNFENIKQAIEDLKAGKLILVADDEDRENEGDLICTAAGATPENINFIATYAKGLICNPMSQEIADKLGLTPMINPNTDNHSTAFQLTTSIQQQEFPHLIVLKLFKNVLTLMLNQVILEDQVICFH